MKWCFTCLILPLVLICVAATGFADQSVPANENGQRFKRFFVWGQLTDETVAKAAREIGVTDITVNYENAAECVLAKRFGFKAYATFFPQGVHPQKMTPAETALQDRLNGNDFAIPQNATPDEKAAFEKRRAKFRQRSQTRYGGEPASDAPYGDVLMDGIPCFAGDEAEEKSKAVLKKMCASEDIDGIAFDFIGYANFKGCYCETCLGMYQQYLAENKLPDNETTKNKCYLKQLVDYNNAMTDYIKRLRPEFKVMTHVYPVFVPEPLYGNRLNVDYCGQTAAWYFFWPQKKIRAYSVSIVRKQNRYFRGATGVPFIGYYDDTKWPGFPHKSPERVEMELKAILDGGADQLMMCGGNDMIANAEIAAVFRKYCAAKQ